MINAPTEVVELELGHLLLSSFTCLLVTPPLAFDSYPNSVTSSHPNQIGEARRQRSHAGQLELGRNRQGVRGVQTEGKARRGGEPFRRFPLPSGPYGDSANLHSGVRE